MNRRLTIQFNPRSSFLFSLLVFGILFNAQSSVSAGPPFITDDPEPVEFHHWEFYISSIYNHDSSGSSGTLPHIEVNYGAAPNLQIHILAPLAFAQAPGGSLQYGTGEVEMGVKFRFQQESSERHMMGIFPLLEIPTGDANRGISSSAVQSFLPLWIQKSWGSWTSYGGGGYWINPGAGNTNYWQFGALVQKDISKRLTLGSELFYTTPATTGASSRLILNIGGQYNFDEGRHLLFSAGHALHGDTDLIGYLGFQWTFGPYDKNEKEERIRSPFSYQKCSKS